MELEYSDFVLLPCPNGGGGGDQSLESLFNVGKVFLHLRFEGHMICAELLGYVVGRRNWMALAISGTHKPVVSTVTAFVSEVILPVESKDRSGGQTIRIASKGREGHANGLHQHA